MTDKEPITAEKLAKEIAWMHRAAVVGGKNPYERILEAITQHTTTLRQELSDKDKEIKRLKDNPKFDGTDAAHPAWWRGHDSSCKEFCHLVNEILDGKDDGAGVASEPWESTKRRIQSLKQQPVLPTKSAAPGTLIGTNSPVTPSHSAEAQLAVIREDLKKIETALESYEGPGSCWIKFKIKKALTATTEQVSSYRSSLIQQGREQGVGYWVDENRIEIKDEKLLNWLAAVYEVVDEVHKQRQDMNKPFDWIAVVCAHDKVLELEREFKVDLEAVKALQSLQNQGGV